MLSLPGIATLVAALSAAQIGPPMQVSPPLANARAAGPQDGITVSAAGYAQAPADAAAVTLFVYSKKGGGEPAQAVLEPAVDALVKAGIARESIVVRNGSIYFTVDHPQLAAIQGALPGVTAAYQAQSDLVVNNANIVLYVNNCAKYQDAARNAAIAHARTKAESVAQSLGVGIGAIKAFNDNESPIDAQGRCQGGYQIPSYQNGELTSPADYLTVRIFANATIRYAIK